MLHLTCSQVFARSSRVTYLLLYCCGLWTVRAVFGMQIAEENCQGNLLKYAASTLKRKREEKTRKSERERTIL